MGPCMQIHVMQEGEQFGPYSKAQLESYLWEGNVQRSDLAWAEGSDEDWLPLWQVMGLPPQPGEVEEEEVVTETAEPEPVAEIEAAPLPVAETEEIEEIAATEAPSPPVEESPVEAPPQPEETPPLPEEAIAAAPPAPTEPPVAEAPPQPEEAEEEAAEPIEDDGRPKLIIPPSAPKRKLKLNVPGS
jgi:hypothetical protein